MEEKEEVKVEEPKRKKKKLIGNILLLCSIMLICFSAYLIYDNFIDNKEAPKKDTSMKLCLGYSSDNECSYYLTCTDTCELFTDNDSRYYVGSDFEKVLVKEKDKLVIYDRKKNEAISSIDYDENYTRIQMIEIGGKIVLFITDKSNKIAIYDFTNKKYLSEYIYDEIVLQYVYPGRGLLPYSLVETVPGNGVLVKVDNKYGIVDATSGRVLLDTIYDEFVGCYEGDFTTCKFLLNGEEKTVGYSIDSMKYYTKDTNVIPNFKSTIKGYRNIQIVEDNDGRQYIVNTDNNKAVELEGLSDDLETMDPYLLPLGDTTISSVSVKYTYKDTMNKCKTYEYSVGSAKIINIIEEDHCY